MGELLPSNERLSDETLKFADDDFDAYFAKPKETQKLVGQLVAEIKRLRGAPETNAKAGMGPREPNNDMVICPNCTCQFVAIPINVQDRLGRINGYNDNPAHYDPEIDRLSKAPWSGAVFSTETGEKP